MNDDQTKLYDDFNDAVNMTAGELEKWLKTDDAKSVGMTGGGDKKTATGGEKSIGYESGEHIVKILKKNKADLDEDDFEQMKRTVSFVHRHLAQKPSKEDIEDSRWRYSLMNWGNDPLK